MGPESRNIMKNLLEYAFGEWWSDSASISIPRGKVILLPLLVHMRCKIFHLWKKQLNLRLDRQINIVFQIMRDCFREKKNIIGALIDNQFESCA